ncbi:DUF434 domain-containing protein [Methermicoccus shengliensis]|uniref:DUF434 domain-containing protein n=1 Tax=Methermicoccus shengliensis TaxID=660064 RepID=A0A832RX11_9EURY|nr:DUF434 domain-containing protein [Methermicoccus shengliensis]KUK04019.1 MAG: Uncharacterized protein XD46_1259 [Euryarchaeota archaeon 55_53]KUK29748.1 MAG: Uncharacterized protein XD62_1171 [Methanosarcinales archeaon 56_1174]MDI3488544.1 hypothetical protein [Methanosarcinales archaeon]MDN5295865.1 hypothetical protein [Methanosarcinales archaeon]HIH69939.1 DUF434 domain-containing protein [Methermicoccus shengliensis]
MISLTLPEFLQRPAEDLRLLLDRGYRKQHALQFVSDHYRLESRWRYVLSRAVHSTSTVKMRAKKKISCGALKGEVLWVDGHNVLITIESVLRGNELFLCDDGFLRDTRGVFRSFRLTETTIEAVRLVIGFLRKSEVKEVHFVFDRRLSRSGELAAHVRSALCASCLKGDACTSEAVDFLLKHVHGVVASADGPIVDAADRVIDLPQCVLRMEELG